MQNRDTKDIVGGVVLSGIGLFATFHALTHLPLGTFARMGPGMFPVLLGIALFGFGLLVLVPALLRSAPSSIAVADIDMRSFVCVVAGVTAFALMIENFGVVPAVVVMTVIVRFAEEERRILRPLVLGAVLAAVAVVIFRMGLGLPFKIAGWPF